MKINYKILWFEDSQSWYDSIIEEIQDYLHNYGFKLEVTKFENEQNLEYIELSDFDLVLMDFQLSSGDTGGKVIESIRRHDIFTEVVFYSQNNITRLRDELKTKGLEGVYCSSRNNEEFISKVQKVIYTTIKKVQDLNNMRGLMMAETSNIDEMLLSITRSYLEKIETAIANQFKEKEIMQKTLKTVEDRLNTFKSINPETDIDKLLTNTYFEAQLKWRTVLNITKKLKQENKIESQILETVQKYQDEVITPRNKLAHVKEITDENGKKVLSAKDFVFNDEECIKLRKSIQKHEENFKILKSKIDEL